MKDELARIAHELEDSRIRQQAAISNDCRSDEGRFVGLLDAILSICRFLPREGLDAPAVRETLMDMSGDEDFRYLRQIIAKEVRSRL